MFLLPLIIPFTYMITTTTTSTITDLMKEQTIKPYGKPLDVRLGLYLESLGNFRSTEMSFDVDLYVYLSWKDSRLRHAGPQFQMINDDDVRQQMWLPDIYFANAREATLQYVMQPNFNIFIAPDGQIAYSSRCTLTVACSLDLRFYPMDQQVCSIRILSYAYISSQVNISWFSTSEAMAINPLVGLPEFSIDKVHPSYCNGTYRYALMPGRYKTDEFSCLSGEIYLSRSIGYNLLQSYIPTAMIVIISWVSFWIDRRAVPARVTLSFTTLVSFTTLGNGLRVGLAQVSYAKAIDIWYGVCLLFVFMALLEFAIVNSFMRKSEKYTTKAKKLEDKLKDQEFPTYLDDHRKTSNCKVYNNGRGIKENKLEHEFLLRCHKTEENELRLCHFHQISKFSSQRALRIDQNCRIWFPGVFFVFNVCYWMYYYVLIRNNYS